MNIAKKGFQLPKRISFDEETLTDFYGKLVVEPLERGFGITIGNSLRRILLSSLEGAAVTGIRIPGVLHEFSQIKGVKEDVVDILLNVKKLRIKMYEDGRKTLHVKVKGPKDVTGADIETDSTVQIINKDHYIARVGDGSSFEMEMYVRKGRGYVPAESNKEEDLPIDIIPMDSIFSPITRVNFHVEKTRVGKATDYDKLIMEVWTDGSITPKKAVSEAASILVDHLDMLFFSEEEQPELEMANTSSVKSVELSPSLKENLLKSIDELELSVRAYNCLKNANIKTIADLVQKTEHEMMRTKNFGRKSLDEIRNVINAMGLHFGMKIDLEELKN